MPIFKSKKLVTVTTLSLQVVCKIQIVWVKCVSGGLKKLCQIVIVVIAFACFAHVSWSHGLEVKVKHCLLTCLIISAYK